VLNGTELGSGSIRIHRRDDAIQSLAALRNSTPRSAQPPIRLPAGCARKYRSSVRTLESALGLDRLVMILAGETSIRDRNPFPKTAVEQTLCAYAAVARTGSGSCAN